MIDKREDKEIRGKNVYIDKEVFVNQSGRYDFIMYLCFFLDYFFGEF